MIFDMEDNTAISFANVGARYDDNAREVLSDVSFNISSGAFYFLSGASGAGKTTLLRLIYQLHRPCRGQIKLFGRITNEMSRDEIAKLRHKMAIVFQEYSLLSHMSVFDNVALPLRVRGISESKIKKLVSKTLEWVGLAKYADANPATACIRRPRNYYPAGNLAGRRTDGQPGRRKRVAPDGIVHPDEQNIWHNYYIGNTQYQVNGNVQIPGNTR